MVGVFLGQSWMGHPWLGFRQGVLNSTLTETSSTRPWLGHLQPWPEHHWPYLPIKGLLLSLSMTYLKV